MSNYELPDNLKKFIAKHIVSVEQLEILFLLGDHPQQTWTVPQVFQAIQSSPASVAERLSNLQSRGFLERTAEEPPAYRYHPQSDELARMVVELRSAYRQSRVKVIEAIFAGPMDQAKSFADSFKFRKGK